MLWSDNWTITPYGKVSTNQLKSIASSMSASLYTQDPKYAKLYVGIAKRADKTKRFSTWEKNMRNKPDGNILESYYDRSDAVVEVCGNLIDAGGIDAGYDDAASDFETTFNQEKIASWSPDPDATIEAFAGSLARAA